MQKINPEELSVRQIHHLLLEKRGAVCQRRLALFEQEVHGASPAILDMGTVQMLQYDLLALDFVGSLYPKDCCSRRPTKVAVAPIKIVSSVCIGKIARITSSNFALINAV